MRLIEGEEEVAGREEGAVGRAKLDSGTEERLGLEGFSLMVTSSLSFLIFFVDFSEDSTLSRVQTPSLLHRSKSATLT